MWVVFKKINWFGQEFEGMWSQPHCAVTRANNKLADANAKSLLNIFSKSQARMS